MFTGLIEDIGKISARSTMSGGLRFKIESAITVADTKIDDSICVQGVCLTVTGIDNNAFWVDAVGTTLTKTTVADFKTGQRVNLERALKLGDRIGGHIVQGHVNGVGTIVEIEKPGENYFLNIALDNSLLKYVVSEGSIAIDGISLTVARLNGNNLGLSIIPHTWKHTTLNERKKGDRVNVETDFFAKYVENIILHKNGKNEYKFSNKWFSDLGY